MADTHSDALVFFGATGDLAYKKIFPALQAMVKRGTSTCRSSAWRRPAGPSNSFACGRAESREARRPEPCRLRKAVLLASLRGRGLQRSRHLYAVRESLAPRAPGALSRHPAKAVRAGRRTAGKLRRSKGARVIVEKPFGRTSPPRGS